MKQAIAFSLALVAASLLPGGAGAARTYRIMIEDMKFGRIPAGVRVGDAIQWINRDMFRHTASARDGSFAVDLPPGKTGTSVMKHAGRIAFYCKYHPGMTGNLVVQR
jgi:plastocyanin